MSYDIQNILDILYTLLIMLYQSSFVMWVKVFLAVYLIVLLIDIILLLILRDVGWHMRVGLKGMDLPTVSKGKMRKRWDKVKARLESESPSQYKVAIIEADAIAEEILGGIGYSGSNMIEKLEQVGPNHLDEHSETLREAHQVRNRIVHEADFTVDHRMAMAVIGVYESFLRYLEFLD